MNSRKWTQLLLVLIIASLLLIGATQRFDTIIAKRIITTSSSGVQLNGAGTLSLASGGVTMASGDLTLAAGDATVTAGDLEVTVGATTLGGDRFDTAQATFVVVYGVPITPTGYYQPITSATSTVGEAVTNIAAPTDDTIGKTLELHNINASQVITIDGTGVDVECKTDIVLGAGDILGLRWNGDDWNCRYSYDNS